MKKEVVTAIILIGLILFVNSDLTGNWHKIQLFPNYKLTRSTLQTTQTAAPAPQGPTSPTPYIIPTAPIIPTPSPISPTIIAAPTSPTTTAQPTAPTLPLTQPPQPVQESSVNNNCANAIDDDLDGKTDCSDKGCFGPPTCQMEWINFLIVSMRPPNPNVVGANFYNPQCYDNQDNDLDTLTDCNDPDCFNVCDEGHAYSCFDNIDNDKNGLTDAADQKCAFFVVESNGRGCFDGLDNDGNGLTDCLDPACLNHQLCAEGRSISMSTSCFDGLDNDGDQTKDCIDLDCINAGVCGPTETGNCADGIDNDLDGSQDCLDTDCGADQLCACTESDGGVNFQQFGAVSIGGLSTPARYDQCDNVLSSTYTPIWLMEKTCVNAINLYMTQVRSIDCTKQKNPTTNQPYIGCRNGRCV